MSEDDLLACPYCFRDIKKEVNFCKYCGNPVKKCPECGSFNKVDSLFCGGCGKDIKDVEVDKTQIKEISEEKKEDLQIIQKDTGEKLIVWPPTQTQQRQSSAPEYKPAPYRPSPYQKMQATSEEDLYQPSQIKYPYPKIKFMGVLGGPIPTSNVFVSTLEATAYALALIAMGIFIMGLGLTFFGTIILPLIGTLWGGILLLSAPFFGIYYVASNWLYKTFRIKRPVNSLTVLANYTLSTMLFSLIGLILAPIYNIGSLLGYFIAAIASVIYLMVLIVIPLKAYLADLSYVKAAVNEREKNKGKETEEQEIKESEKSEEVENTKEKEEKKE